MDKLTQMQQHITALQDELFVRDTKLIKAESSYKHHITALQGELAIRDTKLIEAKARRNKLLRITHAVWIATWLFTITIAIDYTKSVRADNYDLEQINAELMNAFNRSAHSCALEIEMKQQAIKDCIETSAKL